MKTMSGQKNIQVIDGALNCTYDIFSVSESDFRLVFPADGQDIEFAEDLALRIDDEQNPIWQRLWEERVDKKDVQGIHGTLFYGLEFKREFYPTKRESEMTVGEL
jgi:hypothetical protein